MSVDENYSVTRAEARDHFNKAADTAGVRWAWDKQLSNSQTAERNLSRAPSPGLRRLWVETSAAGKVMDQLRKLEGECASLFRSNAEQPIFYQEDLVRPLVEALGIDEMLTSVLVPAVREVRPNLDRLPKPDAPSRNLPAKPPRVRKANSAAAPLPPVHEENLPAADGNTAVDRHSASTGTEPGVTERKAPAPTPVRAEVSITRAQARAHFNEIADRAGLHSAWNAPAITSSRIEPIHDIPNLASKAIELAKPPVSNSERSVNDAEVDSQDPDSFIFSSAVANSHASLADAPVRSPVVYPSDQRMVRSELTTNQQKVGQVRWDQVVRPLLETIQSSQRLARSKPASEGTRFGPRRKSESDGPNPVSEIPMTGLRRLAEMAVNSDGPSNNTDGQNTLGNPRTTSGVPNPLAGSQVAVGDETDFASQLAEHLRSEVLRHGIRVENN